MPTTGHLSAHLQATDNPMAVELAFRYANDGKSQCTLTLYRKSNDGGVSLRHATDGTSHCTLTLYRSPMTVELAFRRANDGASQCPLTLYR